MKKKIQIRIMPDGTIESKTINIKGKACTQYAEIISNLTDSRIIDQQYTDEYYEEVVATNSEELVSDAYITLGES